MSKFFEYTDNYDALTSFFSTELPKLPVSGYFEVNGQDERPDLVSHKIYNDTQYWWIILMYNGKLEYTDIATGEKLKYPSVDDIEDLFFSLKAKENAITG